MKITVAKNAQALLRQRHEKLLNDTRLPPSVRQMISCHMGKPWISGFWSVAIRPTGSGSKSYLDFRIGETGGAEGDAWYFPSRKWWIAHAKASHPPDGAGCDVDVHTKFLSSEGSVHEFDYATILLDGTMQILGRSDFAEECSWWTRAFGAHGGSP